MVIQSNRFNGSRFTKITTKGEMMADIAYDIIIVGGGVMGSSTAYHLMNAGRLKVAVIEKDPTYARASTPLSIGNVRTQFNLEENVKISQYAYEFLETFEDTMAVGDVRPHIAWHREGNLFLVNEEGREKAERQMGMQKDLGCNVQWWSRDDLDQRLSQCNLEGFVGATFGPDEG